jgi:methenyltetrahydromethanopterin cyclohydrolase
VAELNLNERAWSVADQMADRVHELGIAAWEDGRTRLIDAGVKELGSLSAGLMLARACLSDLGTVQLVPSHVKGVALPAVAVNCNLPVAACMASQYAGWQIKVGKYFAMGSGPMRAVYGGEPLFAEINHRQRPTLAVGVLESGEMPDEETIAYITGKCGVMRQNLTLLVARTASLAGGVQVVARSVETAMHKLHTLGFDLTRVVGGYGVAPVPPVAKNDMAAIGRTNDAVLYGGEATLYVTGDDESLADLGPKLPSSASKDYGQPFKKVFKQYDYDFYKIDPLLFSPAAVSLQNIQTGRVHAFGAVNHDVLAVSFFE